MNRDKREKDQNDHETMSLRSHTHANVAVSGEYIRCDDAVSKVVPAVWPLGKL